MNNFFHEVSSYTNVNVKYVELIVTVFFLLIFLFLLKRIGKFLLRKFIKDERRLYIYNSNYRIFLNTIVVLILIFILDNYISNLLTFISFMSAAFAFALRDIILNYFCGIYIKVKKIFRVEDRIEVNGVKGDVMDISTLEFSILEVDSKEENGQSTGIIVTFPNSVIFTSHIKNSTKGFKYIWDEIVVRVPLTSDIAKTKQELYKIVNTNEVIKRIPKKMINEVSNVNDQFRVYYNKYDPVIYTKIAGDVAILNVRYLIHPKKARAVESVIWDNILLAYKEDRIELVSNIIE